MTEVKYQKLKDYVYCTFDKATIDGLYEKDAEQTRKELGAVIKAITRGGPLKIENEVVADMVGSSLLDEIMSEAEARRQSSDPNALTPQRVKGELYRLMQNGELYYEVIGWGDIRAMAEDKGLFPNNKQCEYIIRSLSKGNESTSDILSVALDNAMQDDDFLALSPTFNFKEYDLGNVTGHELVESEMYGDVYLKGLCPNEVAEATVAPLHSDSKLTELINFTAQRVVDEGLVATKD